MTEPIITEQAQADLDEMWDHISERNERAADRLIDRFYAAAQTHVKFPESGKSRFAAFTYLLYQSRLMNQYHLTSKSGCVPDTIPLAILNSNQHGH
jgi:plasmid stabilization system protein ParE